MKYIKKYPQLLILIFLANTIFLTANIPFIQRVRSVPAGTIPTYQHQHVVMDYLGYIGFIREGAAGAWRVRDLYTTEPSSQTGNMFYFILLGKIAAITRLSPTAVYHLVRIIQFQIFIVSAYLLATTLLRPWMAFRAVALALIATPPASFFGYQIYRLQGIGVPAWWMMHPFRNADMLPHHMASAILMFWVLRLIIRAFRKKTVRSALIAGPVAFFSTIFHPVSALVFGLGLPLAGAVNFFSHTIRYRKQRWHNVLYVLPPFLFAALAVVLIKYDITTSFPFNQWLDFDVVWYDRYTTYVRDFFLGGGALLLIGGPLAVWTLLKSRQISWHIIAVWALLPFILIPISTDLGIAKFRFALLLPYLPLSLMIIKYGEHLVNSRWPQTVKAATVTGFLLLFFGITLPSLPVMYRAWNDQMGVMGSGMYYTPDFRDAAAYLAHSAPPYAHILSAEIDGIMLPAYDRVVTYVGQYMETVDFDKKIIVVREFFGGRMTPAEAEQLLTENRIRYIFYGPEEQSWGPGPQVYGLPLTVAYHNPTVTVYAVAKR